MVGPVFREGTDRLEDSMTHPSAGKRGADIVVATDFQRPARRALLHGVKLAAVLKAPLHIVHVIKTPVDRSGAPPDSRLLRSLRTSALLELGRLARATRDGGVAGRPVLLYGEPVSCLLETITRTRAGLLVMGTEGRIGWDRLRLGSTAAALVREAPCPVLTVHGGVAGDAARHPARVHLQRMLVATDFSRHAAAALRTAAGLAEPLDAAIRLVHVAESSVNQTHAERRLAAQVRELRRGGVEADGRCLAGKPVDVILEQAAAWQADLLAAGTSGRRGLHRLVLGSVTEELLRRAGCPVLTVRRIAAGGRRAGA